MIFPGTATPLLVETPQSVRLVDDVVAGDRFLGLVLQRNPEADTPRPADLWLHGCAGRVRKMLKFPDGTVRILVEGLRRFRIKEFVSESPYLVARVEKLKDVVDTTLELAALTRNAAREFQEIVKLSPTLAEEVKVGGAERGGPGAIGGLDRGEFEFEFAGAAAPAGVAGGQGAPVAAAAVVEPRTGSPPARLQNPERGRHLHVQEPARLFPARANPRHPARLGEVDSGAAEIKELRDQVEANNLPEEPKRVALKELDRLQQMPPAVAEYTMTRNYLDWLINLPWAKFTEDKLDLADAAALLDQQHFGLTQGQGPAAGVFGGHQAQTATQRPHFVPGRPARRRKNFAGQERGGRAGPEIRADFAGRDAG